MHAEISPAQPILFMGQRFKIRVVLSSDSEVTSVNTRILGQTQFAADAGGNRVRAALRVHPRAPHLVHMKTAYRVMTASLKEEREFLLTVSVDEVPPSFDGVHASISYRLVISYRTDAGEQMIGFPIVLVGRHGCEASLLQAQSKGKAVLVCKEVSSVESRLALRCPFEPTAPTASSDFVVNCKAGIVGKLEIPIATSVGKDVVGWVDMKDAHMNVTELKASLVMVEVCHGRDGDRCELSSRTVPLAGIEGKRFSLHVPFGLTANFSADDLCVDYFVEFVFVSGTGSWGWTRKIDMYPPAFSSTKPYQIVNV